MTWRAISGRLYEQASALNNLAICCEDGLGVATDLKRARTLYAAAAEQGNVHALNNLGFVCMMQEEYGEAGWSL